MPSNWQPEAQDIEDYTADMIEADEYLAETIAFICRMQQDGATRHNPEWASELRTKLEHRQQRVKRRLELLKQRRSTLPSGR